MTKAWAVNTMIGSNEAAGALFRCWEWFNGKTRVAFSPKQMSAEELFASYIRFRRSFYSFRSIFKRMAVSRTNLLHNLFVNLGYKWSLGQCE